ncbi:YceI family protein [Olleya sp. YSTF-M6]|uniref:YceI family protein n=1 Tax=Olleya sediminilitoris TaxID=2795739 RepID=A0ABS1WJM6_9FLAO|nr:YceI family protein [Olleya sediminilitoris]MBL7559327.1 YceI family protein [Olleya sediminilitoris]
MKKITQLVLAFTLILAVSCKDEAKTNDAEKETTKTDVKTEKFVVKPEATTVKFTAYKTTEKVPVGGQFNVLKFDQKTGSTPQEALNDLSFSIPITGLFTDNEARDLKLKTSFFGEMLNPEFIKGTIKYVNNKYVASITMNNVTKDLPLDVKITDKRRVAMTATMQLKDWDALGALSALNKVCFDLHKGADGVSKTWEEVAINVNTFLREN